MVKFRQKGDFKQLTHYFQRVEKGAKLKDLEKYAQQGVEALSSATPVDTGFTAKSWYYKMEQKNGIVKISFCNSNIQNGIPIAIILQYGHGTRNGGWVEGRDYINPAIQPILIRLQNLLGGRLLSHE